MIIAKIFDIDETEGDILFYKVEKLGFSWSDVDEMIFFFLEGGIWVVQENSGNSLMNRLAVALSPAYMAKAMTCAS